MLILLITIIAACLLVYKSPWFRVEGLPQMVLVASFILKMAVGFALLWAYGNYLDIDRADADVFKYFDDGVVMHSVSEQSMGDYIELFMDGEGEQLAPYYQQMYNWEHSQRKFLFSDNRTMIRLHSIFNFVSRGDIRIHQVFFSLLSFLGLVFLFKGLDAWLPLPGHAFLIICILPPSLLFWGSGMLKESLVMLPLGITVFGLANLSRGAQAWLALIIGVFMFTVIKPYIGLCLVPAVLYLSIRRLLVSSVVWSLGLTVVGLCIGYLCIVLFSASDPMLILQAQQQGFIDKATAEAAGSMIELSSFDDIPSFIAQCPNALFNTFFRPGFWEVNGVLDGISAIENLGYLLLILVLIRYRRRSFSDNALIFCLLFTIVLAVLIGSVTPVLGALVRYKVPMLPFLMFVFYQMVDFRRYPLTRFLSR